jgi:hypothetical protein
MSQSVKQLKEQLSSARMIPHQWGPDRAGSVAERDRAAEANNVKKKNRYRTRKTTIDVEMAEWRDLKQAVSYASWWWEQNTFEYLWGQRLFYRDRRDELWGEIRRLDGVIKKKAAALDGKRAEILAEAREALGDAYDESCYPAKWADVFSLEPVEFNLDPPSYLERDDQKEYKRQMLAVLGNVEHSQRQFEQQCYQRMAQVSYGLSQALGKEGGRGLGDNAKGMAALFDRVHAMRFEGTAAFRTCMQEAKALIEGVDFDEVKQDKEAREDVRRRLLEVIERHKALKEKVMERAKEKEAAK